MSDARTRECQIIGEVFQIPMKVACEHRCLPPHNPHSSQPSNRAGLLDEPMQLEVPQVCACMGVEKLSQLQPSLGQAS